MLARILPDSAQLWAIVMKEMGVSSDEVVDSANFVTDLGADSLDLVEPLGTAGSQNCDGAADRPPG